MKGRLRQSRHFLCVPVAVGVEHEQERTLYALNLSPGGMCLQARETCGVGERLCLRFRLPGEKQIQTEAEVVWVDRSGARPRGLRYHEMGVRFLGLADAERAAIGRFVERRADFWTGEDSDPDAI
ncbi:MAG: PilZ domain-containing protein [Myxococcota bacterium]